MNPQQGAGGCPGGQGFLAVDPQRGLALLDGGVGRVAFEGIALGPGVYVDAAGRRVRVRREHLPLVAARMAGVFLRDLHREDMGASVGVVQAARVEEGEVRFTGDVRLEPYVAIVREFWPHVRFSLGFRYDAARLGPAVDGAHDLPDDFLVDHLALVPQGQYPNARLVRLLNRARTAPSRSPRGGPSMTEPNELEQLRQQRDDALRAAEQAEQENAQARVDLEAAQRAADDARLELGLAKNRLAAEVMKLELAAGKDFDLDARKQELTALELGALDQLRGGLRRAAAEGSAGPKAPARPASKPEPAAGAPPAASGLDLDRMSLRDTLRLAFQHGVM